MGAAVQDMAGDTGDGVGLKHPGQVLVADDDEAFRESIGALIRERGFDVQLVANGSDAVAVVEGGWGDVVIADINMPGNTDLECLERLRAAGVEVGLILVTGYPTFGTAARSLNLGVTNYIVKPFEFDDLCTQIEIALKHVAAIRGATQIRARLDGLSRELGSLISGPPSMPGQSMPRVVDLVFDRVIGILLDLRLELSRTAGLDSRNGETPGILRSAIAGVAHNDILFQASAEFQSLSPREREVMLSLVSGNRVSTISTDLFISQNTVRNHLKSIFNKLGVRSQVELLERFKPGSRPA